MKTLWGSGFLSGLGVLLYLGYKLFFSLYSCCTWVRLVCSSVCCVCLVYLSFFGGVPPAFPLLLWFLRVPFCLRSLRGRSGLSLRSVLVVVVLASSLRRGFRRFFLWGFPMSSSFSFVVPSVPVAGPVSSFSRLGVALPSVPVFASFAPVSLSPLSSVAWGSPVVLDRLGWEPSFRSVLVWVSGSSSPLVCRVASSPRASVSALVAELRALVRSGAECRLGVRGSWSGGKWFCAVAPV